MNHGSMLPTNKDPVERTQVIENEKDETKQEQKVRSKFHKPVMKTGPKGSANYIDFSDPEVMKKPLRAHKVGENGGDIVLRTENESRIILVPEKEVTVYERTGQPTSLTVFLVFVIMILGALLVYLVL